MTKVSNTDAPSPRSAGTLLTTLSRTTTRPDHDVLDQRTTDDGILKYADEPWVLRRLFLNNTLSAEIAKPRIVDCLSADIVLS